MKKYVAIAPKDVQIRPYLTGGREYPIIRFEMERNRRAVFGLFGHAFYITVDNGMEAYCLKNGCAHLCGNNWTIKLKKD